VSSVAAVEFVVGPLSADAHSRIDAGRPIVILRSGEVIEGRLTDIGGTHPLQLSVDTASGRREFPSSEVAQVWVNPSARAAGGASQAVATSGTAGDPISGSTVMVPANVAWTDTGITVRRGDRLRFHATGDIMISSTASSGPGGSPAVTVPGTAYPVAGAPAGALVARVGNGAPFVVGVDPNPINIGSNGRLQLGINDTVLTDNSGNFSVTIARVR
jgi:hypothetical protein